MLKIKEYRMVPIDEIGLPASRLIGPTPANIATIKESIDRHGQLQPIGVVEREPERGAASTERFVPVFGVTRLLAMKELGHREIAAAIVEGDVDDLHQAEIAENYCRRRFNPSEIAKLREAAKRKVAEQLAIDAKAKERRERTARRAKTPGKVSAGGRNPAPKNKGGRPKGGISEVAREMGLPRSTVQDMVKPSTAPAANGSNVADAEEPRAVNAAATAVDYLVEARRQRDELLATLSRKLDAYQRERFLADAATKQLAKACAAPRDAPSAATPRAKAPEAQPGGAAIAARREEAR